MNRIYTLLTVTNIPLLLDGLDPWAALGKNTDLGYQRIDGTAQIYKLLQRIGLYGCIVTAIIFLATLAFRWGDARVQSETKDKLIWKFIVAFMICALTFFMSVVLKVAQNVGGY